MKRSFSPQIAASIFASAAFVAVACSSQSNDDSESNVAEQPQAAHNFCGNNRCDHGETCSTCSQDCGSCADASTPDAGGSVCGSTAAPPGHYQHVVIFSFENRTWFSASKVGIQTTRPRPPSIIVMRSTAAGLTPPTLRFFAWAPPTVFLMAAPFTPRSCWSGTPAGVEGALA